MVECVFKNKDYYKELIDCLKFHILNHDIKYRQMFRDRAYHHDAEPDETELDIQFKLYYQYIKICLVVNIFL